MMFEYAKVLLQHLWKNITLLLVFNVILFRLMAENGGLYFLSNDDDQMLTILMLFALENFIYAMWLQWSPHQKNFWRQITDSEPQLQGMHFTLFMAVSIATQLFPVVIYIALQSHQIVHNTPLDYVGYLYIWFVSLLAYGAGVIVSWWRKWSILSVLFLLPFFWDLIFTSLFTQIASMLLIAMAMIIFVFLQEPKRDLFISVVLSFAVYEMLQIFAHGVLVQRENIYQVPQQIIADIDTKSNSQVIYKHHVPLFDYPGRPSLIDDTNGFVDWITGDVQIPDAFLSDFRNKQKLESGIKALWHQHQYQKPRLELINHNQLGLFFANGIYTSDGNGDWQLVWKGTIDDQIIWYEMIGETKADDYHHGELFATTDKLIVSLEDRLLIFTGSGNYQLAQTLKLDAPILVAEQQKIARGGATLHRLMLLTTDDDLLLYEAGTGSAPFNLVEQVNTGRDLKTLIWEINIGERSLVSWLHTQIRWYSWRSLYPEELFDIPPWFLVSQLAALLACVFLYKKDEKKLLIQKSVLVAMFSWPLLITLLYSMPRKKSDAPNVNSQLTSA